MRSILFAALLAATMGAAPAPSQGNVTVHIRMFAFVPQTLRVVVGTSVRFVNDDSEAHTVTSSDRSFDSGGLDTGDAWVHVFSKVGTYAYFCALHPYMKGSVVVVKESGK
jgi:plastocyanin